MAFLYGGVADKLGNDYEYRFICKKIIEMMQDNIISIICDPVEYNSKIDIVCQYKNKEKLYQCKARNASRNEWSIKDLKREGIISTIIEYVDDNKEYHLVTGVSSIKLKDFFNRSRETERLKDMIDSSKEVRDIFEELSNAVPDLTDEKIYKKIKNVYIDTYNDDSESNNDLEMLVCYQFNKDGKCMVPILKEFITKNIGKRIQKDNLINYLKDLNLWTNKNEDNTENSIRVIENLKKSFKCNIEEKLINGKLIHRKETEECLNMLENNQMVLIYGESGIGKSGIIYEIIQKLENDDKIILPLSLDGLDIKNSEINFSKTLGFSRQISIELANISKKKEVILVIDQLDAIKNIGISFKNSQLVCNDIIRNVLTFNKNFDTNIKILVCCRTYDLKGLPFFNNLINNQIAVKYEVGLLDNNKIDEIKKSLNIVIPSEEKKLLKNINNLNMWLSIKKHNGISNINDLIREFINEKKEEVMSKGCTEDEIERILNYIVNYMEQNATLNINKTEIQGYKAYAYFVSVGLLIENENGKVNFYHQSVFEYLIMKKIDKEIIEKGNILNWIGDKDKQTLKMCYRIENYIKMKIQENTEAVYNIIKQIINNNSIRFIIKYACISALNMIKEKNEKIEKLIIDKCTKEKYISMCNRAISGNKILTEALSQTSVFKKMLISENYRILQSIKDIIYNGYQYCDEQIIKCFEDIRINVPTKKNNLIEIMKVLQRRSFGKIGLKLQEYIIENFDIYFDLTWIDIKEYRKIDDNIFQEMINKIIIKNIYEDKKMRIFLREGEKEELLSNLAKKISLKWFEKYIGIINNISDGNIYDKTIYSWFDENTYSIEYNPVIFVKVLIIEAGKRLAKEKFLEILKIFENTNNKIVQMLAVIILSSDDGVNADLIYKWLISDKSRFKVRKRVSNPFPECTYNLIKKISPYLTDNKFNELEKILYYYKDYEEIEFIKRYKERNYSYYYNRNKYILLCALDRKRLKPRTKELIEILKRNFKETPEQLFKKYGFEGVYSVKSTISDVAEKLSDKMWIKIMNNKEQHEHKFKIKGEYSLESCHENFAIDFKGCLIKEPKRFCKFLLKFSEKIPIIYLHRALDGIVEICIDKNEDFVNEISDDIICIIKKFAYIDDKYVRKNVASLIGKISQYKIDDEFIEILKKYAKESLLENPEKYGVGDKEIINLETNRINSLSGVTIESISKILKYNENSNYIEFVEIIEEYLNEPLKEKKYVTLPFIYQLFFKDKDLAIKMFFKAIRNNFEFLTYGYGNYLFYNIVNYKEEKIENIIKEMKKNPDKEISKIYGAYIASQYIFTNKRKNELNVIINSDNLWQKVGVVQQAIYSIYTPKNFKNASYIVLSFINSDEQKICDSLSRLINKSEKQEYEFLNNHKEFIKKYLSSKCILKEIFFVVDTLKSFMDDLCSFSDIIFVLTNNLLVNDNEERNLYEIQDLLELLIRLNEEAKYYDDDIEKKSLDFIDKISEKYDINLGTYLKKIYDD